MHMSYRRTFGLLKGVSYMAGSDGWPKHTNGVLDTCAIKNFYYL